MFSGMTKLFRRASHGLDHFVVRLIVVKLRLEQASLSIEFLGHGVFRLRAKRFSVFELLFVHPA